MKVNKATKSTSIALGVAIASGISVSTAQADTNPFSATALSNGYMQVAEKNSEGKCGDKMNSSKSSEAKCGGNMDSKKSSEGKCGADKMAKKSSEGKCGEGKCGGNK